MTAHLTLIVNLETSPDRMASATAEMLAQGLAFERFEAFDGRPHPLESYDQYDAKAAYFQMGRELNGGEIGCYLSHRKALAHFLQTGAETCLVLEDDLMFLPGARPVLDWLVATLAQDDRWDLVNLGKAAGRCARQELVMEDGGRRLMRSYFWPSTCTAVLWSRKGAADFLAASAVITAPIDLFTRRWVAYTNRGFALDRPIIINSGAESVLDAADSHLSRDHQKGSLPRVLADVRRETVDYALALYRMGQSWLR